MSEETPPKAIAAALEQLHAHDPQLARDAQDALESLTWGEGLEAITQYELQQFLWYVLPRKWLTTLDHRQRAATALGRLLELVGLPRYAAICHAPPTAGQTRCSQWRLN